VTYTVERLAQGEKLDNFGRAGLRPVVFGAEGPPAYILPHGNRDIDVPVVVAVSTIRKR
jgi:hypothetical protein